jgi:uncharacterized protein involved in exopolysaccharide biosynthesis
MDPVNPLARREPAGLGPVDHPERAGPRRREVLDVVFRRKRRMLQIFAVVLALAAAVTLLQRPRYEDRSSILVKYGSEYVYRPEVGEQRLPIALTPEEILNSEGAIVASDELAREVVQSLGAAKLYPGVFGRAPSLADATRAFRTDLDVQSVPRSSVLQVTFSHPDPALAAEALHLLVERYRQKHVSVFSEANLAFMERQLGQYEAKLADSDGRLEAYRQEKGVFEYTEQMNLLLRRRAELETAHRQAGVELGEAQRRLTALRGSLEAPSPPDVSGAIQTDAIRVEGDAQSRRSRLGTVSKLLEEVDQKIRDLDSNQRQLAALHREVAQDEKNLQTYKAKVEEMRVASELAAQKISNISVIDAGSVPTRPVGSRRAVRLALGAALAGLTAALYAFVAEHLSQGMSTPERVERRLQLPVLVSIGRFGEP